MDAANPQDPASHVDDTAYAQLWALLRETRAHGPGPSPAHDAVTRLLFEEARLLDERLYDEWLSVFAPQCMYWVPRESEPGDPRIETGIYLDDRRRLNDRVAMIRGGYLHAQTPPSRTRRMLTNVEQWPAPDGRVRARANVVIWEYRKGHTRAYPGWQAYEIVTDPRGALLLSSKIVSLLDSDAPQGNYAFIL